MSRFRQILPFPALLSLAAVAGDPTLKSEYQLKAQFLITLLDYVQWPADGSAVDKDSPLIICVLGRSPFKTFLDEACQNRVTKGRRLQVKYSQKVQDLKDCSVIFLCESEESRLTEILNLLRDKPILTMSDTVKFATQGTMVNLYLENKQIRMAVNLTALQRSGLRISSHVLKLAKIVE